MGAPFQFHIDSGIQENYTMLEEIRFGLRESHGSSIGAGKGSE